MAARLGLDPPLRSDWLDQFDVSHRELHRERIAIEARDPGEPLKCFLDEARSEGRRTPSMPGAPAKAFNVIGASPIMGLTEFLAVWASNPIALRQVL